MVSVRFDKGKEEWGYKSESYNVASQRNRNSKRRNFYLHDGVIGLFDRPSDGINEYSETETVDG